MTDEQIEALQPEDPLHRELSPEERVQRLEDGATACAGYACYVRTEAGGTILRTDTAETALIGHLHTVVLGVLEEDGRDQFHLPSDCPFA